MDSALAHACRWASVVRLTLAGVAVVATAACARVQVGSEFEEDGGARHSVLVVFDRDDLAEDLTPWVEARLTEVQEQARLDGFVVERIDTDREVGVRIAEDTLDVEDAGAALNALINAIALEETDGPVAPFQGTFTVERGAVGGAVFELDVSVDGALLMVIAAAMLPPGETLPQGEELADALRMSYVAVLPGRIRDTNGQTIRSNTVRWDLPYDRRISMRAESKLGGEGSTTRFVIAAFAGVVVVGAVAVSIGLVLLRRRRRGSTPTAHADAATRPGGPPETLAEAGTILARAVGRVVAGEHVASVVDHPADDRRDEQTEGW